MTECVDERERESDAVNSSLLVQQKRAFVSLGRMGFKFLVLCFGL
jgi:hypothetical protein